VPSDIVAIRRAIEAYIEVVESVMLTLEERLARLQLCLQVLASGMEVRGRALTSSDSLSHFEKDLQTRVNEVLHYIWDPIGMRGEPFARDVQRGATAD
jgi:hypothetical protein